MNFITQKIDILYFSIYDFYRFRFKLPIIQFLSNTADLYKQRTLQQANNLRELVFRGLVVSLVLALLIWLSVLMYLAFYYAYVPYVSHSKPIHLAFKACTTNCQRECVRGKCSFPSAHVELTKRNQLLMLGQPYRVVVNLELPESPANRDLGMFMVCADFRTRSGELIDTSCRSAMLQYNSPLLYAIKTVIFTPAFILGIYKQKQTIQVELYADYEDKQEAPVTDVYIEIESQVVELYSASLQVSAHFSGLRYMMFHWPILSASIGISSNLFFIALISVFSWYQLVNSEEYLNYQRILEAKKLQALAFEQSCKSSDDSPTDDEDLSNEERLKKFSSKSSSEELIRDFVDILGTGKVTKPF